MERSGTFGHKAFVTIVGGHIFVVWDLKVSVYHLDVFGEFNEMGTTFKG